MTVKYTEVVWPKRVRIEGKDYPIKHKKLAGDLGLFEGREQCISISTGHKSADEAADTMLHEILHAVEFNNGWDYDEPKVRRIATALLAILRDNPDVAQSIIGNYKWKTPKTD